MDTIRFPEFLASLEPTKYPFIETATLTNGSVQFLEGTFLDAHLYAIGGRGRYYLSRVVVRSDSLQIYVGDEVNNSLLSGLVQLPLTTDCIQLLDEYQRPGGVLVSETSRLALLAAWGLGMHNFDRRQTEFCVTCHMPVPDPGVTGFRLANGDLLSGKVWLLGENGVVVRAEDITDNDGVVRPRVRIDIVGDPLYLQQLCTTDNLFAPVNPVRILRIVNGNQVYDCAPDEHGNFNIQMNDALAADAALRIRTTSAGIVFTIEGSTTTA